MLFESSDVDLMQRDLNRLGNLSQLDIEDIHIICYRAKTSYFQGISMLLSKIYVAGYKREALSVVADIIKVLKTQAHKVYSISNSAQNVAGELVFLSCFTNYSNWFEMLRMTLMDQEPDVFFRLVLESTVNKLLNESSQSEF
jgi:hypothetical protein